MRHTVVEFLECLVICLAVRTEGFFRDQGFRNVLLAGGGVFGRLGDREIGIRGCQYFRTEGERELFLKRIGDMEVRGKEHETHIRLRGYDGEGEKLRIRSGADLLNELGKTDFGLALFVIAEHRPLGVVDVVEEM